MTTDLIERNALALLPVLPGEEDARVAVLIEQLGAVLAAAGTEPTEADRHDSRFAELVRLLWHRMSHDGPQYRALDKLLQLAPLVWYPEKRRKCYPMWHAPMPEPLTRTRPYVPVGDWARDDVPVGTPLVDVDTNGAYLAAATSATFAHDALRRTGAEPVSSAGYFLVDWHTWADDRIISPLGTGDRPADGRVWIAGPTWELLHWLSLRGFWPEVTVHDSWTGLGRKFTGWANTIRDDRTRVIARCDAAGTDPRTDPEYNAIKDGYSIAVQMWRGPMPGEAAKSKVLRPDWYDTLHAQHRANLWRKAWSAVQAGCGPVYIGAVDELTFRAGDWNAVAVNKVLRVDGSGVQLGAVHVKRMWTAGS